MFKPSLIKLILAAVLVGLLVPFIQLSQPDCQAYAKLPHGDGAPTVCLGGYQTLASYLILVSKDAHNMSAYGSWNWRLDVAPNYVFLIVGAILAYAASSILLMLYATKLSPRRERR